MNFVSFREAIAKQLAVVQKADAVFRVNVSRDELYQEYLNSFTPEQNPVFVTRTEHECNCCKNFIRDVGSMVAFDREGKLITVWDVKTNSGYQHVADRLAAVVRSKQISAPYYHVQAAVGQARSIVMHENNTRTTFDHFYGTVNNKFVKKSDSIPTLVGKAQSSHSVFVRALQEITLDATETVRELIQQNTLYRGTEHSVTIDCLLKHLKATAGMTPSQIENYAWRVFHTVPRSVLHVRNTSIGTLLNDLSADVELETAVRAYERVVAPANYKRPTALVSKKQVEAARKALEEQGLMSALHRRYAVLSDISINNVLFANRDAKQKLSDDPFDSVFAAAEKSAKPLDFDRVREVSIDEFINSYVPNAESIEVYLEKRHASNFVSLIAPQDPSSNNLFKWNNNFSWSYNGSFADSAIKERVKAKGGNVTGELCIRLGWFNFDDLDLSVITPSNEQIYFGHRKSNNGALQLDVDENAGTGHTREPVENIFARHLSELASGDYEVQVHNFNQRETIDVGFELEIATPDQTYNYVHKAALQDEQRVKCATITVADGKIVSVTPTSVVKASAGSSTTLWNLDTCNFHPVNVIMTSPNYWDGQTIGNKHWFFMLSNCASDSETRGFYNEFLNDSLTPHRKAMELVGSKLTAAPAAEQLSGLGFSSTKRESVIVRVSGCTKQVIKVVF